MKATIDFYVEVLGMPLVRGNPPYEEVRHYFFDIWGYPGERPRAHSLQWCGGASRGGSG
jgi:catechol 2,3-dioxygenase-like lactoylglutathione lyase family enzyme